MQPWSHGICHWMTRTILDSVCRNLEGRCTDTGRHLRRANIPSPRGPDPFSTILLYTHSSKARSRWRESGHVRQEDGRRGPDVSVEGCEGPRGLDCVHKGATGEPVRGGGGVPEYTPGISNEPSLWMTWPRIKCMGFRSNASRGVCQGAYLVPKDECNRSLLSPPTGKGNGGETKVPKGCTCSRGPCSIRNHKLVFREIWPPVTWSLPILTSL